MSPEEARWFGNALRGVDLVGDVCDPDVPERIRLLAPTLRAELRRARRS